MIILKDYELFVDQKSSKAGKVYYGLFISIGGTDFLVSFITKNTYETLSNLSK